MPAPLHIAVADDEPDMRDYFARILPLLGHDVVVLAQDGRQLVEKSLAARPDLLIVDIRLPDIDGISAVKEICRDRPVPAILVSAYHDPDLIERAEACWVMAYLVKPIKQADLEPAIALAMGRFRQIQALQQEASTLRQTLADRKVVERAKGVLMKSLRLDEDAAFRYLQRLASQANQRLVDAARAVLASPPAD